MKTLRITLLVFFVSLFGLILLLVLQADQMGGEPVAHVVLDWSDPSIIEKDPIRSSGAQDDGPATALSLDRKKKFPKLPVPDVLSNLQKNLKSGQRVSRLMAPVPFRGMIEKSRYGTLPIISEDGRKAFDVYARPFNLPAQIQKGEPKRIAIMITGLGISSLATDHVIHNLPGPVTLSFSPYGTNLQNWVRKARQLGHEVLLEIPFEPYDYPDNDPGPHTLLTGIAKEENLSRLLWLMGRFSGYIGITNAMGEKFFSSDVAVLPILQELSRRGLIYFETSKGIQSTAEDLAKKINMGFGKAHLHIDSEVIEEHIHAKLSKLEGVALKHGHAVGVASSLPLTVKIIRKWSKTLAKKNIILVPLSAAVRAYRPS